MVLKEILHLEEIRHIATAVGPRKQGAWSKWESTKDRAVTWGDLKHIEPQKLSFLIKAVYDILPIPINLHVWRLTTSNQCRACWKTANLKHILTGCKYALKATRGDMTKSLRFLPRLRRYVMRLLIKL